MCCQWLVLRDFVQLEVKKEPTTQARVVQAHCHAAELVSRCSRFNATMGRVPGAMQGVVYPQEV